ncbi:failed axon connections homolog [Ruditapes philippinarum]|uniref:failed axon connections homolog n=1 Tax=Ruditapes philippinarum TaxID=129788 RepID=UPI00295ABFC0|nr:failed axon connections homolog [Ruditapes philippinarum]XP_060554698.1 failed axon connections homolog [Ruditapes philippinarum]
MSEQQDSKWKEEFKKDVVYLHVIPRSRARDVVNISPYAIKLELWLRINNIPFETIDCQAFSKKGQSPFIMFNKEEIPDSNFIIEFLSEYFSVDRFPGLNTTEKAVARAFIKMVEENTSWPIFIYRYVENIDEYSEYFSPDQPVEVRKQILGKLQEWVGKRAHWSRYRASF